MPSERFGDERSHPCRTASCTYAYLFVKQNGKQFGGYDRLVSVYRNNTVDASSRRQSPNSECRVGRKGEGSRRGVLEDCDEEGLVSGGDLCGSQERIYDPMNSEIKFHVRFRNQLQPMEESIAESMILSGLIPNCAFDLYSIVFNDKRPWLDM